MAQATTLSYNSRRTIQKGPEMTAVATDNVMERRWPEAGTHHVPYWLYTDAEIYQREMERIFPNIAVDAREFGLQHEDA